MDQITDGGRAPSAPRSPSRRSFLQVTATVGAALALPISLGGCHVIAAAGRPKLDFGDDFGVLNYAYALETLEADFYSEVCARPPADLRPGELEILQGIREHERQHRAFFKRALNVLRIHVPARDFGSVDMTTRDGVLRAAATFEDLGVAAYNGAGPRLRLAEFLTIAGEIVSVEARHASIIHDLIDPNSRAFAGGNQVDAMGMDRALSPADVLQQVQPFFRGGLHITNL